jgi:hypothetical protein
MSVRFVKCQCGGTVMAHGYFQKGEERSGRLSIPIVSIRAAKYLMGMDGLLNFGGADKNQLEQDILAAGLPQEAEHDVEVVDAKMAELMIGLLFSAAVLFDLDAQIAEA